VKDRTAFRLLIADDHACTVELLRGLLEPEFDIVGGVRDGSALVEAAAALLPDVIVSDISMPCLDGIRATERILQSNPSARVVFVSVLVDWAIVRRGLAAGALGFVSKQDAGDELVPAIRAALCGRQHISRSVRQPDRTNSD
jgi:DNA-binding NarL/FixJ family response regulator